MSYTNIKLQRFLVLKTFLAHINFKNKPSVLELYTYTNGNGIESKGTLNRMAVMCKTTRPRSDNEKYAFLRIPLIIFCCCCFWLLFPQNITKKSELCTHMSEREHGWTMTNMPQWPYFTFILYLYTKHIMVRDGGRGGAQFDRVQF